MNRLKKTKMIHIVKRHERINIDIGLQYTRNYWMQQINLGMKGK